MALSIRVQFLAGYSGREWPPSPARLFKALVCAARSGWAARDRNLLDSMLHEIEGKVPMIAASEATLRAPRQRRFVPNNSRSWPTQRKLNPKKSIDLEEEPLWHWDIADPSVVWYHWPDAPSTLVNPARSLARHTWSVGKGEDFALLDALDEPPPSELMCWRETANRQSVGPWLEVPDTGCLDVCDATFWQSADDPPVATAGVRSIQYTSNGDLNAARLPVSVLALRSGGKRRSWDARLLRQVVGPIRNLLNDIRNEIVAVLASDQKQRRHVDVLAQRVLLGHDEHGDPVPEPHLAVLPIPSVLGPYPDGRIRRVALVGFGCGEDANRRAIVEMAHVLLHGRELLDNSRGTGVTLESEPERKWLQTITSRSRTWVSVTPVIQVAKELTSAEWQRLRSMRRAVSESGEDLARFERRLEARRLELLVRSLVQAIGTDGARPVSVEIVHGGSIAGVHIARHYRVSDYLAETPRLHVRVRFDRPVAGPIAIGRGRHAGFGLFWPDHDNGHSAVAE